MEKTTFYENSDHRIKPHNIPVNKLSGISLGIFFSFMILAIIITCALSTYIKNISDYMIKHIIPEKSVTITVLGTDDSPHGELWLIDEQLPDTSNNLFSYCINAEKNGLWEFRSAEEWSYNNDTLVSYGVNSGSTITFTAPVLPESYLLFWSHKGAGKVSVETDGQIINVNTNSETSMYPRIYPFKNSYFTVIIRLLVFGCMAITILAILLSVYCFIIKHPTLKLPKILSAPYKNVAFIPIWIALYLFAVAQYKIGIPNYLSFGDQLYYWSQKLLETDAWWNLEIIADYLMDFRGYWCNALPIIAQIFGNLFKIDPVYFYLIFSSFSLAWLVGYVLPEIYFVLSGKKAKFINVLLCAAIYLIFWNGTLTAVLMDMFGLTAFMTGALFTIKLFKLNKIRYGAVSGICLSIACSFRSAYKYGLFVSFVYGICLFIYTLLKNCQNLLNWFEHKLSSLKKWGLGIIIAIISFVVICIPQLQVNMAGGHIGLLPYDDETSYFVISYGEMQDSSLTIMSANESLKAYSGYPLKVTDNQLLSIKRVQFTDEEALNMPQILSAYSTNFTNTVVYLLKKLFIAFDIKTNVCYPNEILWNESSGMLFSLLNYIVLASAVYFFLYDKSQIKKTERIFTILLFTGLSLPQLFVHVEWRYFISSYVLMYYFFSYHFVEAASVSVKEVKTDSQFKFLRFLCIVLSLAFTISFTICS